MLDLACRFSDCESERYAAMRNAECYVGYGCGA